MAEQSTQIAGARTPNPFTSGNEVNANAPQGEAARAAECDTVEGAHCNTGLPQAQQEHGSSVPEDSVLSDEAKHQREIGRQSRAVSGTTEPGRL